MCIISGSDQPARYGGHPHASQRAWYDKQAKKGGWFFDRAGALLARLGAHPLGDVVAGRMRARDWLRYELTPSAHDPSCRYRRLTHALRARRLAVLAAAVGLAVGVVAPAGPAAAHHDDGYSTIYCTAHKPAGSTVIHSDYWSIQPDLVTLLCTARNPDVFAGEWEYFVRWVPSNGAHWRQGGYFWCGSNYCEYHG